MQLSELVALVLGDLSVGAPAIPAVSFSPLDEGLVEVLLTDEDGMGVGFGVDPALPEAEILHALADRIPDAYVELYRTGLPLVPSTERPARADVVDGVAVWTDPAGGGWSCPVGGHRTA
ncbi:hypothetical protein [Streptomyces griseorubiginosus]|uniref:Uncharacterized protein n=1 Tax=Streptomyces griseorubiginosus TaxID=67304 RepID=A0A101RRQ3_9ACTN|nr:hypothetical protein [Streptomyces griseorubiginosus]KUN60499.1 hypothetical protein AQJ54_35290 [Streptomyces griseorubiginosus]